ncbi:LLM class flavin-dependent oxidoreductase [Candidatus Poriferisodalis sp.]|uniref:LLM class flavin-dependent oxidoreductase n=1 Tax=Candidatus Poriferisodalis sp. TaxID=3101277 RepID=UPI003D1248C4
MKIGLATPNSDYGQRTTDMALEAEQRGYDSLWVGEHSHIPASRQTPHPAGIELPRLYWHMRDPFTSLGAAAAVTSRIKLVTGVCLLLEHEVLDLAKSVATLDEVSDGRFLFGVGVGWNREELSNVSPVPWPQGYGAMRETIEALRGQWSPTGEIRTPSRSRCTASAGRPKRSWSCTKNSASSGPSSAPLTKPTSTNAS